MRLQARARTQRDYDSPVESGVSGDYKRFQCIQTTPPVPGLVTDRLCPAHIRLSAWQRNFLPVHYRSNFRVGSYSLGPDERPGVAGSRSWHTGYPGQSDAAVRAADAVF